MEALNVVDSPVTFSRMVTKPWGHEVVFTAPDLPYVGKILTVRAGNRLSLQVHDVKLETLTLLSGTAFLQLESAGGALELIEMVPGTGYTVWPGRMHRLIAASDASFAEASTPEVGTTQRLEDDFGRPDELLS